MIPFNSIQHLTRLEDLRAVFDFVREHIADDGVFIVDLFNPNLEFLLERGVRHLQAYSGYPDPDGGGPVRVEETREYDRARQVNRITWYFRIGGGPERAVGFDMRVIFPQELRLLVEHMGF